MNTINTKPGYGPGVLICLASIASPTFAQNKPAADSASELQEVVVTGVRQAMRDSIATKKDADLISDNISTLDIGELPDVTIAEELNRLPGVNTTRDRGNASQAAIRGLGPRMVLGLVNGREVASSEPSQDLRWEIYPSELLSGAQVYKTQDASLIPGGIAATVDIRTLSPLDYHGPAFSLRAGPTYNEEGRWLPHYDPLGYRASGGYVSHITDDVAVSLAASVQKEKNGFPDFRTWGWNTPTSGSPGDLNGDGKPDNTTWGLNTEVKEVTQSRGALAGAVAWRANDNLTVKFDTLWSQYRIKENQLQAWYGNNILGNWADQFSGPAGGNASIYNAPGNSYTISNGTVVAATLNASPGNNWPNYESEIARYDEQHTLLVTGLNAAWNAGAWDGQVDLSFSDAVRRNRWEAIYLADQYVPNLVYDVANGRVPYAATPGANPADPTRQSVSPARQGQSAGPEYTHDKLGAIATDFTRKFENLLFTGLHFGARISDRDKNHHQNQFNLCPGVGSYTGACTGQTISLANAGLESFLVPGFTAPPMVWGNFDQLRPLVYPNDAVPAGSEVLLAHTRVTEQTYESYVKVDFKAEIGGLPLTGGIGARVAHLKTRSQGFSQVSLTDGTTTISPVEVSNSYTDFLPSLNAVLHLTDDQMLRFGTGIAVSRPPLDALITGFTLNPTGNPRTGGGGNPLLRPYKAYQADLSYEWYFHEESLFSAAVYYKNLRNIIGASQSFQTINGVSYIITSENNGPGGNVTGVELTYQTRFHFLPGVLKNFGIYTNYAYVHSNIHEFTPLPPLGNPYPMVGLAKNTSEFDLFYNQGGFETRVAWKHHSSFTVAPTWVGTTLKQLAPENILDASLSYEWNHQWSARLQGHNLTNERGLFTNDNNAQNLSNDGGYQVYGRSFLFDVAVKF